MGVGLLRAVRLRQAAAGALGRARASLTRLEAGITLLAEDPQARQAFAFTNRAMALQRRNTQAAQRRERDAALNYRDALAVVNESGPEAKRQWLANHAEGSARLISTLLDRGAFR